MNNAAHTGNALLTIARALEGAEEPRLVTIHKDWGMAGIYGVLDTRKTFGGYELRVAQVIAEGYDVPNSIWIDSDEVTDLREAQNEAAAR